MKRIFVVFFILVSQLFWGQNVKVTGKVIEASSKAPLEYATIVLEVQKGAEKQVLGGITDTKGAFSVEVPKGVYTFKVQFFSFKTYEVKQLKLSANKDLGTISLQEDVQTIEGVVVTGEKSTVEMRLDKKIYNVGEDMTVKGGSVTDVLDNVPSVTVDNEGNISLRGNENVRILINGKPSALSGMSAETLRQLPSEIIEKIEVVTNPSARYDAEGTAGIVNIVLKKGKGLGLTGSVSTTVGVADTKAYGGSVNLNLRKNRFSVFNNTSYSYNDATGKSLYEQQYLNRTTGVIRNYQNEYIDNQHIRKGLSTNLGVEYRFTDKISLTNSFVYGDRRRDKNSSGDIFNYDANKQIISSRTRLNEGNEKENSWQYAFNYDHRFNDKGHTLTADYQFSKENENEAALVEDTQNEKVFDTGKNAEHLVKLDYTLPLFEEKATFEAGYQGNFKDQDVNYEVFEQFPAGYSLNTDYSNHLIYKENINAWYAQLGARIGKVNAMAGLRYERTDISIAQLNSPENHKKYNDFFPSIFLGYHFTENNQLSLSYTRRLQRPFGRFINPFTTRNSNTNLMRGNPDLDPAYTHALDLGYLIQKDKLSFSLSAFYNRTEQAATFVTRESGDFINVSGTSVPIMLTSPLSIMTENSYGLGLTSNYSLTNQWRLSLDMNLLRQKSEGQYQDMDLGISSTLWFSRFSVKGKLPLGIDMQATAMYMGPRKTAQKDIQGQFFANFALSKDFLDKKAVVSVNAQDLFNSRKMKMYTDTQTVHSYSEMQWRPRQIVMNFTYRFGGNSDKKQPQRKKQNPQGAAPDDGGMMMY